ncbi:sigma-70 family RNA polymerase sigma factor [Actinocorallia populi]|uniref:sigma-70 family RNA polymerase sigma factor n=1 Tax=Actinocorallia populi TaxID=2079200 RepID=UPI001E3A2BE8|nr:sigma-70 family RNA polymerase sigma factor [Actinocorallia populi]
MAHAEPVREDAGHDDLQHAVRIFDEIRPRLFGIAYRMLGSVQEAEDVVQDAWLRWQSCDRSAVANPAAFLATATTRLSINTARSARLRRETYIGPWLPDPVDTAGDPHLGAERAEALETAVVLILERLSPNERAAYILREAFDYPYADIAAILRLSGPTTRQLVSRARKRLTTARRAAAAPPDPHPLLAAFRTAAQTGDLAPLESLLAPPSPVTPLRGTASPAAVPAAPKAA